jgi:hypothetical protein
VPSGRGVADLPQSRGAAEVLPGRGAGEAPPGRGTGAVPTRGNSDLTDRGTPGAAGMVPGRGAAGVPGRGTGDVPGRAAADARAATDIPGRGAAEVPGRGKAEIPSLGNGEMPGRGNADVPGRGAAEVPGRGKAEVPGLGKPEVPGRGHAEVPSLGKAEVPGRGAAEVPGRGKAEVSPVRGTGQVGVPGRATGQGTPPPRAGAVGVRDDEDESSPGGLRGAGAELRSRLRTERKLRVITLVTLSVIVLGLLPLLFGIRSATRDPVFNSLDALSVPGWADKKVDDRTSGSIWCFFDCRFRERTAQSDRPLEETDKVYAAALTEAGWRARSGDCSDQPTTTGKYTCWTRDEFSLDLWVRPPECAVDAVAAQDPATVPSTGPDGLVPTADPATCTGSTVSIKVQNAVSDPRLKPQPAVDPSLIGETPDPVLTNDPLLDPTPTPS